MTTTEPILNQLTQKVDLAVAKINDLRKENEKLKKAEKAAATAAATAAAATGAEEQLKQAQAAAATVAALQAKSNELNQLALLHTSLKESKEQCDALKNGLTKQNTESKASAERRSNIIKQIETKLAHLMTYSTA